MSLLDVLDSIQIDEGAQTIPDNPPNGTDVEPQTVIPPPAFPNQEMTGYKVQVQQPETSTTTVETRQSENTLSRQDWENMTGQERYDAFLKRIRQNPPTAPVDPEEKERRLRSQGLLRAVGDGLFTLGEAVGLGMGSSVRKRNMPEGDEFKRADVLRDKYGDDLMKWEDSMRSYYEKVYKYNQLQAKDYERYREGQTSKVSTATRSGGDTRSYEYENPEIRKEKEDHELRKIYTNNATRKTSSGKEPVRLRYPDGSGGSFWYVYDETKYSPATSTSVAVSLIDELSLDGDEIKELEDVVGKDKSKSPASWTEDDRKKGLPKLIQFVIRKYDYLAGEAQMLQDNYSKNPQYATKELQKVAKEMQHYESLLNEIQNAGINIVE